MSDTALDLGPFHFSEDRRQERLRAKEVSRAMAEAALAALHAARDGFVTQAAEIYADGAHAAQCDCDRIDEIADRLVDAIEGLESAFEGLDVARDLALYRGPTLSRMRSRYDSARLANLAAEAFAEEILSGPAGTVLTAAVRRRTAGTPRPGGASAPGFHK
jgi:hypothetical protein